ncbi:MAG TPA: hypothetical protein VGJ28_07925 [Micromonosporaceae bacterium]|jgi:hypothetical protein
MPTGDLREWRIAVEHAVSATAVWFEGAFGYPLEGNEVVGPDPEGVALLAACGPTIPADLLSFYATIGEVSLPDIGNGWFIERAASVAATYASGELRKFAGRHGTDIVAFASDGGCGRFALGCPAGGPVYQIADGCLPEPDDPNHNIVAADLSEFLGRLRTYVERFSVNGEIAF